MAKKQPKGNPSAIPKVAKSAFPQDEKKPLWSFSRLDGGGPSWCISAMDNATILEVFSRLKALESMTWSEIKQGTGSHFVSTESIIKGAQDRLIAIGQDDNDELFSLRISGQKRLWGVMDESLFRVIWWDPEHEVCPSEKKNT